MFDKLKQVHIIILLGMMLFTAGGSWVAQTSANASQDEELKEVKAKVKSNTAQTQLNKENFLVLTGELKVTNEQLKATNEKLQLVLDKL